jgi:hypothetical protein
VDNSREKEDKEGLLRIVVVVSSALRQRYRSDKDSEKGRSHHTPATYNNRMSTERSTGEGRRNVPVF